jgi:Rhodopirellula transposase DDE domain
MFCHITANWRGRPLETHEVMVNLIANTQTSKGLTIQADLNAHSYAKGIKISDEEMAQLNVTPADFHGESNYSLSPRVSAT